MPKLNGIEFLKKIKMDEYRKNIPIIIFTTSSHYVEINECYRIGVAGYVLKPLKHIDYISNTQSMIEYWSCNEFVN
ncbi:hypothetical protein RG47T_1191 [Mucilaginibacter polytrichastri]|uniref:Response regulatory domain-containing protein n=2 Tax=Mucilaginibacter polytrichastri TaxID=1302689 RepID=A0A1Q5ZVE8_9SPHI|nr:hypothetical protein RG47T_1191 [Mucilaginibacter polytrichastri]